MAPLPTIASVFRVAINYNAHAGVRPINVIHVLAPTANEEDVFDGMEAGFAGVTNNPLACIASVFQVEGYTITKLDGSSAGVAFPSTEHQTGGSTGEMLPAVAAVLSILTTQRGPRGRGRMFLGPMGEAAASEGLVDGGKRAEAVAGWNEFQAEISGLATPMDMGVASYVYAEFNPVNHFAMRQPVGTLRRRQNQLV
jgi:hypothetical protein